MIYSVIFTPAARRDIGKLSKDVQRRVISKLADLAKDPRGHGTLKLQGSEDLYRSRVGDFRIVYSIDDDKIIVTVIRVRDRKEVYR